MTIAPPLNYEDYRCDWLESLAARHPTESVRLSAQRRLDCELRILSFHNSGDLLWPLDHRAQPMPRWFNETPLRTCRWCNVAIGDDEPRRRNWHGDCVKEYNRWQFQLMHGLVYRNIKHCVVCGEGWEEIDHRRSLATHRGDPTVHFACNFDPLCSDCHKVKTAKDAGRLARQRRSKRTPYLFEEESA